MTDESLPRAARLRSDSEILRLLRTGKRRRVGCIDVYIGPVGGGRPRLGVIVPRYGRSAVERNRLRRRLKEIARRDWLAGARASGMEFDVLVRARKEAYDQTFRELRALVLNAAERPCSG